MKKLLLLAAFSTSSFLFLFAGSNQQNSFPIPFSDSTIKKELLNDPRKGFKDLFESSSSDFNVKLNPKAVSFVEDYVAAHTASLTKMKNWGKPYFDMMDNVLAKHGLPRELKYLSVIESQLKPYAVSWAGAVGPWQFMAATARSMGLRINSKGDERTDFYKSTQAAARYLTYLYGLYNDWLLVIAAYNGGPGNVNSAIRKSGSRNFWNLQYYLPTESRNHVKKFIATHYIMEGEGSMATLTRSEAADLMLSKNAEPLTGTDVELLSISGKYNSIVIAQVLQMNISEFNQLNPSFDKVMAATSTYTLRLPGDKMLLFQANKPQILEQSIRIMLAGALH